MKNWDNLKALFAALNEETEYLVLRNFEEFSDEKFLSSHPDIDFLCRDQQNLKPVIVNKYSICSYYKCFVKKSNHFLQNMTKMMSTGCVKIYD